MPSLHIKGDEVQAEPAPPEKRADITVAYNAVR
jgi:hypothetical protein